MLWIDHHDILAVCPQRFSIFNSFMMVIFLTGIVALILMRTLRKDYAKFARESVDLDELDQVNACIHRVCGSSLDGYHCDDHQGRINLDQ